MVDNNKDVAELMKLLPSFVELRQAQVFKWAQRFRCSVH